MHQFETKKKVKKKNNNQTGNKKVHENEMVQLDLSYKVVVQKKKPQLRAG